MGLSDTRAAVGLACRVHEQTLALVCAQFAPDMDGQPHLPTRVQVSPIIPLREVAWTMTCI